MPEVNGSFYALQRPTSFRRWAAQTPPGFVFSVKGGRFIIHMKKLRDVQTPLANFFASGVLALQDKLGPLLWQLPPTLPASTGEAAYLARRHDERLAGRAWTGVLEARAALASSTPGTSRAVGRLSADRVGAQ